MPASSGERPLQVVDIGARGGPDRRWWPLGSDVRVLGIDADPEECARLNRREFPVAWHCVPAVVGREPGATATLHVTRQPGCSSLLSPNRNFLCQFPYGEAFQVERKVAVLLTTLEDVCDAHGVEPDVLKIDTQGYELEVLLGGERALASVFLVEVEVEFNPLYIGQPLFGEVDSHLRGRGFILLGLRRSLWRRRFEGSSSGGTIVHGDALYYRNPALSSLDTRRRVGLALSAYAQLDLARSLGLDISEPVVPAMSRGLGYLLAWLRPHREVRRWVDRLRAPGARDWHDPDFY